MKVLLIFLILKLIHGSPLEEFKNGSQIVPLNSPMNLQHVSPMVMPPQAYIPQAQPQPSPCQQNYCQYYPSLCNSGCEQRPQQPNIIYRQQPPQTKTVQVPVPVQKVVPETVTRSFPKQPTTITVLHESETLSICPHNYELIEDEDDNKKCIRRNAETITCPHSFEWRDDRCVNKRKVCPNEYTMSHENICMPRIICPQYYYQHGDECLPPRTQCPNGWRWNGKICEVERLICPMGFQLTSDNECERETFLCPPNYKNVGQQCVREEATCPSLDYRMNENNVCEKTVNKCPSGSFEQYGTCVTTKYECPAGTKTEGDKCLIEEVNYKTITEV